MASIPQVLSSLLLKTPVMVAQGVAGLSRSLGTVQKRHQLHTPCGMPMWTPCCAQQLGRRIYTAPAPTNFICKQ